MIPPLNKKSRKYTAVCGITQVQYTMVCPHVHVIKDVAVIKSVSIKRFHCIFFFSHISFKSMKILHRYRPAMLAVKYGSGHWAKSSASILSIIKYTKTNSNMAKLIKILTFYFA